MSVKHIYTVDDYPLAAYTVKRTIEAFSKNDCIVSDFESPLVLLDRFRNEYENIDMIITDYEMPDFRGNELIVRLRAIKPTIKIIVISAWLDNATSDKGLIKKEVQALNPNLILSKPFPDGWVEELDSILNEVN
jgi:CheY-like chemotaxis protein